MSALKKLIEKVLEFDAKATKGPWECESGELAFLGITRVWVPDCAGGPELVASQMFCSDASFIVHARNNYAKLALVAQRMEHRLNEECECRGVRSKCLNCEALFDVQKIVEGE